MQLKALEKQAQLKMTKRKNKIKIRGEINEMEIKKIKIQKMNKTKR
jgi:hypothetical protein